MVHAAGGGPDNLSFMQDIKTFIAEHERFIVLGHREPDGDCVASQLVLAGWLERRGRQAFPVSAGPFDRPEVASFQGQFDTRLEDALEAPSAGVQDARTAAVILDCSHPDRTGLDVHRIAGLPCLVIDHHASGKRYGAAALLDPGSPSTTLLVQSVIEAFGDEPTRAEAELLVFGFCTDTGFFRHLDEGGAAFFPALARLMATGVSLKSVYRKIYSGRPLEQIRRLGRTLTRTESFAGGKVLLARQSLEDSMAEWQPPGSGRSSAGSVDRVTAAGARGSDDLFRHLQSVSDNQVAIFIREEKRGECSVGLRSTGALDVSRLAQALGGGGHSLAAGFTFEGSVEAARRRMLDVMSRYYDLGTPDGRT